MARDFEGISRKIVDAATEALEKKGWPSRPCSCPTAKSSVATILFEAPSPSGAGSSIVPPMVYVYCEICGVSTPYLAERLLGRDQLRAILKG